MIFSEAANIAEELAKSGGNEEKSEEQDTDEVEASSPAYPPASRLSPPSTHVSEAAADPQSTLENPSEVPSVVTTHDAQPESVDIPHETPPLQAPLIPAEPLPSAATDTAVPEQDKPHSDLTEHESTSVPLLEAELHETSQDVEHTEEGTQSKEQEVAKTEVKEEPEPLIAPVPLESGPSPEPEQQGPVDAPPVTVEVVEAIAPPPDPPATVAETPAVDPPKTDAADEEPEASDSQPAEPPSVDEGVAVDTVSIGDSGHPANAEVA
jgi:hypothetical protein